ncbi:MAG: hypothetical protein IT440_14700 [Phycisphaeraceae bacterium]|nr:hypothetical protein [Phycisphaeraceae bacterium]
MWTLTRTCCLGAVLAVAAMTPLASEARADGPRNDRGPRHGQNDRDRGHDRWNDRHDNRRPTVIVRERDRGPSFGFSISLGSGNHDAAVFSFGRPVVTAPVIVTAPAPAVVWVPPVTEVRYDLWGRPYVVTIREGYYTTAAPRCVLPPPAPICNVY